MAKQQVMDERFWETWDFEKDGGIAHYAEIAADPDVLQIMLAARDNKTELGYWRDIAVGLAKLVDILRSRVPPP